MSTATATATAAGTRAAITLRAPGLKPQPWCASCGYVFPFLVLLAPFGTGVLPAQSRR